MRHSKARYQMNRFTSWHKATVLSMVRNLVKYQSIKTTKTKALASRSLAEKLISLAKDNSLAAKRRAFKILGDHKLVKVLFDEVGPRFAKRTGGYTRILDLSNRRGDNAKLVLMEFTEIKKKEPKPLNKAKVKTQESPKGIITEAQGEAVEEKQVKTETVKKHKPPISTKPSKKFLGGLRKIFKKERDSL